MTKGETHARGVRLSRFVTGYFAPGVLGISLMSWPNLPK